MENQSQTEAESVPIPSRAPKPNVALVMKGGGVKGLAYVGALSVLTRHYTFHRYVGTSAGAITAILLAAGYTPNELQQELRNKDFRDFFDAPWWKTIINLIFYGGCYQANSFTVWIDGLLAKKMQSAVQVTMGDIQDHGNRVTVFASRKGVSALRFDSSDDRGTAASYAARCSMSYPIVFIPQTNQGFLTFDGGMQHNYPVDQLQKEGNTEFLGLYLGSETFQLQPSTWPWLDWLSIWTESGDAENLRNYAHCTVVIDPAPVTTFDYDLSPEEKDYLILCGRVGAQKFIAAKYPGHPPTGTEETELTNLRTKVVAIRRKRKQRKAVVVSIVLFATLAIVLSAVRMLLPLLSDKVSESQDVLISIPVLAEGDHVDLESLPIQLHVTGRPDISMISWQQPTTGMVRKSQGMHAIFDLSEGERSAFEGPLTVYIIAEVTLAGGRKVTCQRTLTVTRALSIE